MSAAGLESERVPFDAKRLDTLMGDAGLDCILVTSRHNIQYILGGYWFFFFENFDAIGISRYLPILVYKRGQPEVTTYIGNSMEGCEKENGRFWCKDVVTTTSGSLDAIAIAIDRIRRVAGGEAAIGIEAAFMPSDAADALRAAFPRGRVEDAHFPLERLRAVKRPDELQSIRVASELVVESMIATFKAMKAGMTKRVISEHLRAEETRRGLRFDYCLIAAGTSFNRAPNDTVVSEGDIVSLDSGGSSGGFFGDLCRMGIVGEPTAELVDLLGWMDRVQQAARRPIRVGTPGRAIFEVVDPMLALSPLRDHVEFVAHGMGIIGHEAPRLTSRGPVKYPAFDADRPLEAGMVLSIETTLPHPRLGYLKLEDTVIVTEDGCEGAGDDGRGWNRATA